MALKRKWVDLDTVIEEKKRELDLVIAEKERELKRIKYIKEHSGLIGPADIITVITDLATICDGRYYTQDWNVHFDKYNFQGTFYSSYENPSSSSEYSEELGMEFESRGFFGFFRIDLDYPLVLTCQRNRKGEISNYNLSLQNSSRAWGRICEKYTDKKTLIQVLGDITIDMQEEAEHRPKKGHSVWYQSEFFLDYIIPRFMKHIPEEGFIYIVNKLNAIELLGNRVAWSVIFVLFKLKILSNEIIDCIYHCTLKVIDKNNPTLLVT